MVRYLIWNDRIDNYNKQGGEVESQGNTNEIILEFWHVVSQSQQFPLCLSKPVARWVVQAPVLQTRTCHLGRVSGAIVSSWIRYAEVYYI